MKVSSLSALLGPAILGPAILLDPAVVPSIGYDECVERLAHRVDHHGVDHHDDAELEEVAYLIGQLAVVIE